MNYLGIKRERLEEVVVSLNQLLADYHLYYQNLRSCHWNIEGAHFFDLHQIFEELYNDAKIKIDDIAERVLTLRYTPMSTLSGYLKASNVDEIKANLADIEMVNKILKDHGVLIAQMREVISAANKAGDEGTIDMIGGYVADLEKRSWMLDSWTSKKFEDSSVSIY